VLVGTKCDLTESRQVAYAEGEKCAREWGARIFMETSAKTGLHMELLFSTVMQAFYEPGQPSWDIPKH